MAQQGRATLKATFETGDQPTQAQFADLMDSMFNFTDDGTVVSGSGAQDSLARWNGAALVGSQIFSDGTTTIVGTNTPDASAIFQLETVTQGFLPSRVDNTQRDAIVLPAKGLQVFSTTSNVTQYNSGTPAAPVWANMSDGGGSDTIYSADGTFAGNRALDADNNNLTFTNVSNFLLENVGAVTFNDTSNVAFVLQRSGVTVFAFSDSSTFNSAFTMGNVAAGTSAFRVNSAQSLNAWGTNGIYSRWDANTHNDNSSAGVVASAVTHSFAANTFNATSVTTFTDAATMYISGGPIQTGNVTITNSHALWIASGTFKYQDGNEAATFVLTSDANGVATWQAASVGNSIYTADDTLAGNRIVSGGAFDLTFDGNGEFNIDSTAALNVNFKRAGVEEFQFQSLVAGEPQFAMGALPVPTNSIFHVSSTNANLGTFGFNGAYSRWDSNTFSTVASQTNAVMHSFGISTLNGTLFNVITTVATVYIAGDPVAGTDMIIGDFYGLWNAGNTRLDGYLTAESTVSGSTPSTGTVTLTFDDMLGRINPSVTQTGAITLDVNSQNNLRGASIRLEVVADTSAFNIGADFNILSGTFDTTNAVVNIIWLTYIDTDDVDVTISQP